MTIDKEKLKALAERAVASNPPGGDGNPFPALAVRAVDVMALLAEIERTEGRLHDVARLCATVEQERDQLKAENELMRALIGDAATDLRKASAWVCREVESGTRSATHWAVRLRERADRLDAAMAKEASNG